ncbi:carboxypeptidase-like regulatory domain-containing protein [Hymenobacter sp. DH14]|uniref:Carboxypeptidase-like regulatory domain-containing protein n=1 Tax=Hymenobacter cyanobacteriorum TaxID=2926463 RepID=A0A9X1VEI4_9BACT|nr:carboxypeptidase-like regulatory domain-containing protein [Hymenobacter cyanobacteriorum]MCI1187138.1 carboxypeptidase-like regulatory domain-containing protein [Hymenobacter cyanobacteriorum]
MKLLVFAGLLLAVSIRPVAAQQRLNGKILDAATGQPVPYASVAVLNTTAGTTSNAEGEFELKASLPGRLVISELGHRRDTVAVAAATATPLLVRLQPAAVALPEVTTGSYLNELIAQAYRQLRKTYPQKQYGQAFYRQVTRLEGDATEVQEMVWDAASSCAGVEGTALAQARFAKKKALLSFNNFSVYTKQYVVYNPADDSTQKSLIGLHSDQYLRLKLLGVTQSGPQELVEIGFESKAESTTRRARGSMVIDQATHQLLRLRLETTGLKTKSNNPMFKFKDEVVQLEWVFQPQPGGAATLDHLKVDYTTNLGRVMKPDLPIHVASFAYFYNGRPTPKADITYAPAKGGEVDLATIKKTTYDPAFWQNNAVVKRTPLEEQVMKSFEQKGAFGTMLTP